MAKDRFFRKKLLPTLVTASVAVSTTENLAAQDRDIEELVVIGIRGAQISAINNKREATSIMDSISSEDIGKLPDVTITDSLQRITGVQVVRSAGEGGKISIRGLPRVLTTLNGESFLAAGSITTAQPDLNDIPSQLFSGADVIKSTKASHTTGGITGIVNLKTFRPFDLKEGLTLSGAAEVQRGESSEEEDPSLNGLISWQNNRFGVMASVAYQEKNLANYYSGMANGGENAGWSQVSGEDWAWGRDLNGDGDIDDAFLSYQGHQASNRFTERERIGFNGAVQLDLGEGFELVSEIFYTDMEEFRRSAGLVHSDKWNRWGWFEPRFADGTPSYRATGIEADSRDFFTTQAYTGNGRRLKSFSTLQHTENFSRNINIELKYDNGGKLTTQTRFVSADAEQNRIFGSADIDLANGNQWGVEFQDYADGRLATNPNGYTGFPQLTVDYRGDGALWSGFGNNANADIDGNANGATRSIGSYLSDISSYGVGAITSENNFDREASLDVARFDGAFELDEGQFITSIEAGIRYSARKAENNAYELAAPFGENGCLVKWKATDVTLNQDSCNSGLNLDDNDPDNDIFFTAGRPMNLAELGNVIEVTDLGPVRGIPAFFALDPAAMDDVLGFHNSLYPGNIRSSVPGSSYKVDLDELSYYVQANFALGPLTGNIGIRQVDTTLTVVQNVVGNSLPYGLSAVDAGDRITEREYGDTLPSLNISYNITDNIKLRAAYAKTMTPLDLEQWGGAFDPDFTFDGDPNSPTFEQFIAVSASETGNPNLDPWRADNFDLSLEYYFGEGSLFNIGAFLIDVESFAEGAEEQRALPDQDGVVRRSVPVNTIVQGEGADLKGVEVAMKFAFSDFTSNEFLGYFGADINYTYSPSDKGKDLAGNDLGFVENSEDVYNIVAWFQSQRWQARLGYNYRSERVLLGTDNEAALIQDETAYLDASISYDITDEITLFINGSNITDESERYYWQFEDQEVWENTFEARYSLGIRATF
ncbi:TonB-dependent receptor [Agarilytica rhodophyticola]|uniref:TonB-dependent receptor n=1 Tax=Agarilytica rhodophyticola TaxID=1737490 RepID=UPI001FEC4E76|nr:TonB-dependent receptor [Agarilytica rhodophyticola]